MYPPTANTHAKSYPFPTGWFLFDIVFYGNTLFASAVTKAIYKDSTDLMTEFGHNTILFAIALPGCVGPVLQRLDTFACSVQLDRELTHGVSV